MKRIFLFAALFLILLGAKTYAEESYLVWLDDSVQLFSSPREEEPMVDFHVLDGETLAECLDAGIVKKYIPNATIRLCETAWNQEAIKAAFPQKVGCRGNDVTVAVIDSGIQEIGVLSGRVLPGKNYLDDTTDVTDNVGHGTFVSGIIAAVADRCNILPLKCFDSKESTLGDVLEAIYDAVVNLDADVINMSMALNESDFTAAQMAEIKGVLETYVSNASTLGVLVVASVGNEGNTVMSYPAGCTDAIGVGAVDRENRRSVFSQYNKSVFVVAPGESLISTAISGYTGNSGTSFSAPHVTALAAIAKSMQPNITTAEFKTLLMNTSRDLGAAGWDSEYGYGLIDCEAATKKLMEGNKVYVSPVYQNGGRAGAVFYNNSADAVTVSCIGATYGTNALALAPVVQTQTIAAGETVTLETTYTSGILRFMAWNSLSAVQPLGSIREK